MKNQMTRRDFLKAGGTVVLIAAGGGLWRSVDQGVFATGSGPAYEPWHDWKGVASGSPLNLVRAAILAANAHNTQPWLFRVKATEIELHADPRRNIGNMDPLCREMYISLGCSLENLSLAAPASDFSAQIHLMPEAMDQAYVAHVALTPTSPGRSPLYDAIPHRHTNRAPYDTQRPVSAQLLQSLSGTLRTVPGTKLKWFLTAPDRNWIGNLTVEATKAIVDDDAMSRDSNRWYRSSWADTQQKQDGITIDAQGLSTFLTVLAKMAPPVSRSQADSFWVQTTRDHQVATAGAYGLISVDDFSNKVNLLEAGRAWQQLHLAGTAQGLAMQPLNQIIERTDREVQVGMAPRFGGDLQKLVSEEPWRGVFLFRLGYPLQAGLPSPRRSVEEVTL